MWCSPHFTQQSRKWLNLHSFLKTHDIAYFHQCILFYVNHGSINLAISSQRFSILSSYYLFSTTAPFPGHFQLMFLITYSLPNHHFSRWFRILTLFSFLDKVLFNGSCAVGSPRIKRVILTLFMIVMSTLHTESPLLQLRCGVNFHN